MKYFFRFLDPLEYSRFKAVRLFHKAIVCSLLSFRFISSSRRTLPDFILVGARKCGTTSLFTLLAEHSQVLPPLKKETHFFSRYYSKGLRFYKSFFPIKRRNSYCITGEATPYYLYHPHAIKRISKSIPDVKIIILLRDPVKRLVSHYYHNKKRGVENRSLQKAIDDEEKLISSEYKKMIDDESYFSSNCYLFSYKSRGYYIEQLKRCFEYVPKKNILLLNSEEFFINPKEIYSNVCAFLGIKDNAELVEFLPKNVGGYKNTNNALCTTLNEHFKSCNNLLEQYLNKKFNW